MMELLQCSDFNFAIKRTHHRMIVFGICTENYSCFKKNILRKKSMVDQRLKDTHREKAPLIETPALTKSTNMGIWVVGTTNQLFILKSTFILILWVVGTTNQLFVLKLKQNFQKNKVVTGKTPFFLRGPLCSDCFICLNIGF